ncbi:Ferric reductase transmembrane component-like domain [Dillenia turbinata]|uniref:Ferric reductase transmembrane component-like domain n=1 Tax=Dillenia turbinata TaxID=194707 RepID=A0AAN8V3C4_9MAGN
MEKFFCLVTLSKFCFSERVAVENMAKATFIALRVLMMLLCVGWISLWLLKPTEFWTEKWREAEDSTRDTIFRYNGLDFAVYTFPVIALAIIGCFYLDLQQKETRNRQTRSSKCTLTNPLIVNKFVGVLSLVEILVLSLFILFLAWTFYAHISEDFKKWQLKVLKVGTRCGLLAEACLALLLFPILRGMSLFRLLGVQFEASVRYHIWLGTAMILFATLHGLITFFIWGVKIQIKDEMWLWQKTGRIYLAGEIALITGLVIWISSLPQIRRKKFEIFYYTHHLYIVFLVFFLFHVGDRHFYMIFSGIFLFALDKLLRVIQSRPETCIVSARVFPSKVIELILPKDPQLEYNPTSIIFMKIPSISKLQWHSFSIASSSVVDDRSMSVIIKCEGWWTCSLYNIIHAELDSESKRMKCMPVAVEGPYGPASMDFLSYDSVLLIGGGIGITPFLSILQEAASQNSKGTRFPSRIQLVYVTKKSQDISLLGPVSAFILKQSAAQKDFKLQVFVTQELQSAATVRNLLNEFSQVQTIHFDTKCSNHVTYGPESLCWIAAFAGLSSFVFFVFLCIFNHAFIPSRKKDSKEKTPSSLSDFLLICAFVIAILCSTAVAIILRWKRIKNINPLESQIQHKGKEAQIAQSVGALEEHEIHYGGRPNFQDLFHKFATETGGQNVGVLVSGPESMKESVACLCRTNFRGCNMGDPEKRASFTFHSLSFTL